MLIYEMESPFLRSRAFPLACLDEATILSIEHQHQLPRLEKDSELDWQAHSLFTPRPPRCRQWIVVLLDMKIQEVSRRKILATL